MRQFDGELWIDTSNANGLEFLVWDYLDSLGGSTTVAALTILLIAGALLAVIHVLGNQRS